MSNSLTFSWRAVDRDCWPDLAQVLGERGGREGCWCMRWRLRREQFEEQKGERNRRALESGVAQGKITGIVGYLDGQPAAWCSVGPRDCFPGLAESDLLAPIDDQPVWSITCLFVARAFRRAGLGDRLLVAAVEYAAQQGAKIIEGYPLAPGDQKMPLAAAWTGFESVFKRGGFVEKARRVPMRPIYRFDVNTNTESE